MPIRYRNYNLELGQIVILNNYNGRAPYLKFKNHKIKYNKSGKKWNPSSRKIKNSGNNGKSGNGKNKNKGNGKN